MERRKGKQANGRSRGSYSGRTPVLGTVSGLHYAAIHYRPDSLVHRFRFLSFIVMNMKHSWFWYLVVPICVFFVIYPRIKPRVLY